MVAEPSGATAMRRTSAAIWLSSAANLSSRDLESVPTCERHGHDGLPFNQRERRPSGFPMGAV